MKNAVEPVPVSDRSITLVFKYSQTTLFLTIEPNAVTVDELKARILSVLAESAQPIDPQLNQPFSEARPQKVEIYVAETRNTDTTEPMQYTRLQDTNKRGKSEKSRDTSARLDTFGLQDGQVLYLGFPGEPHVQIPSFEDEVIEGGENVPDL